MGFYMDRHDLESPSASGVAAANARDREIQDRYGVRYKSYWFDYERAAAFCLVEAPSPEAAAAVHREAHGSVANEIIPVDPGAVALFLGRTDDPLDTGREAESAFRIVLFTDLEGSTALVQRIGDEAAMELLRLHDAIIRTALAEHRGREVKHTGDGIMASFASVRDALCAAVAMQRQFAAHTATRPEAPLAVRIGMSAGEPVTEHGDLFGAAVQLAARLCAHATPGSIVVASVVADLAIGKQFRFGPRRPAALKGFPGPIVVCEVDWGSE